MRTVLVQSEEVVRLTELEVGSWFRSPRWSDYAVALLLEEVAEAHGLVCFQVYRVFWAPGGPAELTVGRPRLSTVKEVESDEWETCPRPTWVDGVGGSARS